MISCFQLNRFNAVNFDILSLKCTFYFVISVWRFRNVVDILIFIFEWMQKHWLMKVDLILYFLIDERFDLIVDVDGVLHSFLAPDLCYRDDEMLQNDRVDVVYVYQNLFVVDICWNLSSHLLCIFQYILLSLIGFLICLIRHHCLPRLSFSIDSLQVLIYLYDLKLLNHSFIFDVLLDASAFNELFAIWNWWGYRPDVRLI